MSTLLSALRATAEETRLRLLALLLRGELTVSELVECVGQSQPRVSRHLKLLVEAGLLERTQEGTQVFYRVVRAEPFGWIIDGLAEHLDAVGFPEDADRRFAILGARQARAEAYFRAHAATWDDERSYYVDDHRVEAVLRPMIGKDRVSRLVDIGTGTGRMLDLFGSQCDEAIGIDRSRDMLAIARTRLEASGHGHIGVRLGDMADLPLKDASCDLALFHQVLHFADDPSRAIEEAARILRPGGRIVIVDFLPHHREELRTDHAHRRLGFSSDNIQTYGRDAKLSLVDQASLMGDSDIDVGLWCLKKDDMESAA